MKKRQAPNEFGHMLPKFIKKILVREIISKNNIIKWL